MADPITLAVIATAAATTFQGVQAHQQAKIGQKVSEQNAASLERSAQQTREEGGRAEAIARSDTRAKLARMRAIIATGGSGFGGTTGGVLRQSIRAGEENVLGVRRQFENRARGFLNQSLGQRFQASGASKQATGIAFGTPLRTGTQALTTFATFKQ